MNEKTKAVATLLLQAGHAHHRAFIETDGFDPEWPLWYADYLIDRLPPLLERELTRSELVYQLVHLAKVQPAEAPEESWPDFYARRLVQRE